MKCCAVPRNTGRIDLGLVKDTWPQSNSETTVKLTGHLSNPPTWSLLSSRPGNETNRDTRLGGAVPWNSSIRYWSIHFAQRNQLKLEPIPSRMCASTQNWHAKNSMKFCSFIRYHSIWIFFFRRHNNPSNINTPQWFDPWTTGNSFGSSWESSWIFRFSIRTLRSTIMKIRHLCENLMEILTSVNLGLLLRMRYQMDQIRH